MDRSFLSNAKVVAASRNFVCIRLATYEDKNEAEFLKSLVKTRSGELENTVFDILAPDGKTKLSRAGRGPFEFGNASRLAKAMDRIASDYAESKASSNVPSLPYMKSFELALNVASADMLPVVAVAANSDAERKSLETLLSKVALNDQFAGQLVFAKTKSLETLELVNGKAKIQGIYLIAPDKFGTTGEIVDVLASQTTPAQLNGAMQKVIAEMPRESKSHRNHVQAGIEKGIDWVSEIPETDPQSIRARQRARGKNAQEKNRSNTGSRSRDRQPPPSNQSRGAERGPRGANSLSNTR